MASLVHDTGRPPSLHKIMHCISNTKTVRSQSQARSNVLGYFVDGKVVTNIHTADNSLLWVTQNCGYLDVGFCVSLLDTMCKCIDCAVCVLQVF